MKTQTFNKRDGAYALRWAKKLRAVRLLGGCCAGCGNEDIRVLDFHHKDNKVSNINLLLDGRWKGGELEKELNKCVPLCRNCHLELHCDAAGRQNGLKSKLLEASGISDKCSICGYRGRNLASLGFHHRPGSQKRFIISDVVCRNRVVSINELEEELAKCDLVCSNCHLIGHTDNARFERLKVEIERMSEKYREIQKAVDRELVFEMLEKGKAQIEIARHLGCAKSTICGIAKRLKAK